MDAIISAQISKTFDEIDGLGYFVDEYGKEVKPATRYDGEAGPSTDLQRR